MSAMRPPSQSASRPSHRRFLRGFSLVELVMVVVLIGILASVALPRFGNRVARHRVQAAANRIAADIAQIQRRARLTSGNAMVRFAVATSSYRIKGLADPDRPGTVYTVDLTAAPYEVNLVSADFDGDPQLQFDGYGKPDSGGTVVISNGRQTATITVDADTGHTSVD